MQRHLLLIGTALVASVLAAGCGSSTTYTPSGSSTTYPPSEAIRRGDVVVGPGEKISNLSTFTRFLNDLDHHKSGTLQITRYTSEGDPIFADLSTDGSVIRYTFDDSQDKFGGQNKGRQTTTCVGVSARHVAHGTTYVVTGCQDKNVPSELLFVPSSNH